jgi:hypothetical protein
VTVANVATESASDVIADDEGGVYIGMVRRGAASLDLFVQHLDADGVALWDPAGLCVGEERISSAGYLNRFWLQLVVATAREERSPRGRSSQSRPWTMTPTAARSASTQQATASGDRSGLWSPPHRKARTCLS